MNTKLIMTSSALMMTLIGISLIFLPNVILNYIGLSSTKLAPIFLQLLGATYFAFAMLNWMAKGNLIGGIYNRPIAVGNFTHFFIGALVLIKIVFANQEIFFLWIVNVVYLLFTLSFGLVLFKHPLKTDNGK